MWDGACQESDEQEAFKRQLGKMTPAEIRDYALRLVGRRPLGDNKQDGQLGKVKGRCCIHDVSHPCFLTCCIQFV